VAKKLTVRTLLEVLERGQNDHMALAIPDGPRLT